MMKEIHLWLCDCNKELVNSLSEIDDCIANGEMVIHTAIPAVLNIGYDTRGYRVIVHSRSGKQYEIKRRGKKEASYNTDDAFDQYSKGSRVV